MTTWIIGIPEVHYSKRIVEANTIFEAIEQSESEPESDLEYSHTLDRALYSVIEEGPDGRPICHASPTTEEWEDKESQAKV